jgi:hypothetical protein
MDNLKVSADGESDAQVRWTKSIRKEDGSEIRTEVETIENGFLITTTTEGNDSKGEWKYNTTKQFSETNPLGEEEDEEKELSLADKLESFFKK